MQFIKAEMHCLIQTICVLSILLDISVGFELFDERAWTDKQRKDNFFDYKESRDVTEEVKDNLKSFSNNIDFELFDENSSFRQSDKVRIFINCKLVLNKSQNNSSHRSTIIMMSILECLIIKTGIYPQTCSIYF